MGQPAAVVAPAFLLRGRQTVSVVARAQMRDLRAVKLPQGVVPWLEEPGPDPGNSNSAVSIAYQVRAGGTELRFGVRVRVSVRVSAGLGR